MYVHVCVSWVYRNLRQIFQNWKTGIIFLEWTSAELVHKEKRARRHLLTRLLQQWREQATHTREEVIERADRAARGCLLRFPFRLWCLLQRATLLRKTLLASRGITHLRVRSLNSPRVVCDVSVVADLCGFCMHCTACPCLGLIWSVCDPSTLRTDIVYILLLFL